MSPPTDPPGDAGAPAGSRPGGHRRKHRRKERNDVRTIDELEAANARLRASESRHREFIHTLPAALYTCDADGRIQLYNDAAVELWGGAPGAGEAIWTGPWRMFDLQGGELPPEKWPIVQAVREGRFVRGEFVIERPDGTHRYVQANATPTFDPAGRITGATNLLVDRTGEWRAERDQARLAAIVASSDDAIISKDLNGIVQTWNGGAERIFGWRADEIIGRPITTIIPGELVGEEEEILARLRCGERIEHFETVRLTKDGRRLDVSLAISPILDSRGRVIGASKISRDITEARRIANAMAQADRNKDQFLAMLAHELRNPLAVLASAVELLGLPDAAGRLDVTRRMMERQMGHLVHLVDDLMDLSRISRGVVRLRKQTLDVRTVVEQAVESVRSALEEQQHALEVRLPRRPLAVHGDPTRVEQVLVNLLTNAARFTPPGGRIEVEAAARDGRVVLTVRDNGIGMSAELLANVFEPFAQSEQSPDRAAGGLGIGLSLAKSITEIHGGSIEARSEGEGRGSEFVVTLPGTQEAPDPEKPEPDAQGASAGTVRRRVLVVDDNEDAAQSLSHLLEFSGHEVHRAYSGPAALAAAAEVRPDVILLDIGLPEIDGYEVARRLRADPALANVLLIALSGYCQDEDRRRSREAGFDHHVGKPAGHRDLLRLLEQAGR